MDMSVVAQRCSVVGTLSKVDLSELEPEMFPGKMMWRMLWKDILQVVETFPEDRRKQILLYALEKKRKRSQDQQECFTHWKECKARNGQTSDMLVEGEESSEGGNEDCESEETVPMQLTTNADSYGAFLRVPSADKEKSCYYNFIEATSAKAVSQEVCVVCACSRWASEGGHLTCVSVF